MRKDLQDLWSLAEPYVRDAGFDLIEVQFGREQRGAVLRLCIDRPAGETAGPEASNPTLIGVDDCEPRTVALVFFRRESPRRTRVVEKPDEIVAAAVNPDGLLVHQRRNT